MYTNAVSAQLNSNVTTELPLNGTGRAYAAACQSLYFNYSSEAWSYTSDHYSETTYTIQKGGLQTAWRTQYANTTALCDGHPRVTNGQKLTPTSTGYTTFWDGPISYTTGTVTNYGYYPAQQPSCKIQPNDCEALWESYSLRPTPPATTIAPNFTPPCMNISAYDSYTSHVQLVFFPTTASRNMCASTPTATVTSMDLNAKPLDVQIGKTYRGTPNANAVTAIVGEHTFTSGTAYISIGTVYAGNKCEGKRIGPTINDVVIAMKPESVLSLRYKQPMTLWFPQSSMQTGYPVSYADFNKPIPWSAYNGQAKCGGPVWGSGCDFINDDEFHPQLAVPPGLRSLDESWKNCQFAYAGLLDPPIILDKDTSFQAPTFTPHTTTAAPTTAPPATPARTTPATVRQTSSQPRPPSTLAGPGIATPTAPRVDPTGLPPQGTPRQRNGGDQGSGRKGGGSGSQGSGQAGGSDSQLNEQNQGSGSDRAGSNPNDLPAGNRIADGVVDVFHNVNADAGEQVASPKTPATPHQQNVPQAGVEVAGSINAILTPNRGALGNTDTPKSASPAGNPVGVAGASSTDSGSDSDSINSTRSETGSRSDSADDAASTTATRSTTRYLPTEGAQAATGTSGGAPSDPTSTKMGAAATLKPQTLLGVLIAISSMIWLAQPPWSQM
ncbi:Hypothetical protein D9617_8g049760 [Elsinoe fawcettii]|nr:Hypothetical protein D9617_8g049760 [Elsinoe fawcettii]